MLDTNYHLPDNSYWVCSSTYNGLSQIAKAKAASAPILTRSTQIGVLKNRKISSTVLAKLN